MTDFVLLWENPDGKRRWEAIEEGQIDGFLEKLLMGGVNPATVMIAYSPILFHWVWKEFHGGLSDVYFQKIDKEIYGMEPVVESKHEPVDVPVKPTRKESKYGWLAPDGRFLECGYGGHTSVAARIVGEIQYVFDPEQHLEGLGWAKIYKGVIDRERYTIGMGKGKKLTDEQLATLRYLGLENVNGISSLL